jgi:hypothetical protein
VVPVQLDSAAAATDRSAAATDRSAAATDLSAAATDRSAAASDHSAAARLLNPGDEIRNPHTNKSVGRLLAVHGGLGLAMVRLQEAFAAESLVCQDQPLTVRKPLWWPLEKKRDHGTSKAQE